MFLGSLNKEKRTIVTFFKIYFELNSLYSNEQTNAIRI